MNPPSSSFAAPAWRGWKPLLLAGGGLLLLSVLFFFHPEHYAFYPQCLLHRVTGWQCPGCGGLRAAYHFLHGNFTTALTYNPLLFLMGSLLSLAWLMDGWRRVTGRRAKFLNLLRQPGWMWFMLILAVLFGLGRNLPWFQSLAI